MANTNEIKRITEILWEQMKINDESDKKASTLTSSRGNNKNNSDDYSVSREFANITLAATTSSKKKSKSNRDSLAFRESPGKPGTKRFNRYLNTQFLKTAGSLGNGNSAAEMDYTFSEQRNTLFYQDAQNSKFYLENYVNISCDQEQEILNRCSTSPTNGTSRIRLLNGGNITGHNLENESFSKIRKNLRPFFKKPFLLDNQFIQDVELEILTFIEQGNDCNMKEFKQDNPSKRLIIHGLASYYSLISKSHTAKNGQRILVLRKQRSMPDLPSVNIIQYLNTESKKQQVVQLHQVQHKKVIKKSQSIYIKKRVLATTATTLEATVGGDN